MTQPLVSICIPTYNAEKTIADTLQSILAQTYTNIEIIIADNGSTDNTINKIKGSFTDPRIKIQSHKSNIGAEANFEYCIHAAKDEYTAIYHADDIYEPTIIETEVAFLEANPDVSLVLTNGWKINSQGNRIGQFYLPRSVFKPNSQYVKFDHVTLIKTVLRAYNFLICPTAMARTRFYQQELVHWRGDLFKSSADLDVWIRAAVKHKIAVLTAQLINYRISSSQWTSQYNSQRITRADFFLVMDYWLQQASVKDNLESSDWDWYAEQQRRDKIKCAIRALMRSEPEQAYALIKNTFHWKMLTYDRLQYQGLKFFVAFFMTRIFSAPVIRNFAKPAINYFRRILT